MYFIEYVNMLLSELQNIIISRRRWMLDEFLNYLLLLSLDFFEEGEYMTYLGQDDLIVILLTQFVTYGEFVGSLHRLVEITTKPAEILLVLAEECCHFIQGLHTSDCADIVELPDSIAYHRTHVVITRCFILEEFMLFRSQPHFAYYCSFVHITVL